MQSKKIPLSLRRGWSRHPWPHFLSIYIYIYIFFTCMHDLDVCTWPQPHWLRIKHFVATRTSHPNNMSDCLNGSLKWKQMPLINSPIHFQSSSKRPAFVKQHIKWLASPQNDRSSIRMRACVWFSSWLAADALPPFLIQSEHLVWWW